MAKNALSILKHHEVKTHPQLTNMRNKLTELIQEKSFSIRAVVTSCFNLVEAYLNGLAWDYVQTHGTEELSMRKKKLLEEQFAKTEAEYQKNVEEYKQTV